MKSGIFRHCALLFFRKRVWLWLLAGVTALLLLVVGRGSAIAAAWLGHQLDYPPADYGVRLERRVTVTAPDGTVLVADVYHPRTAAATPTILVRIPYSKQIKHILFARTIGHLWASHGYTTVIQGTRGRYESGGSYDPPFLNEAQDGRATLEWITQQPWYDGQIGMWGGSYFGYTQWVLADQVDPGLSALIPQICSTDFYRMFYPGGAFSLESALYWATLSYGPRDIPLPSEQLRRGFEGWPLLEADDRAVQNIPFFDTWASHTERDRYWQAVDGTGRARQLQAPTLLMAGWYDPFLPTQLTDFEQIRAHAAPPVAEATRLVIGPWTHANTVTFPDGSRPRNYRFESIGPSLPWFDQQLKGDPTMAYPDPVLIYVMGANTWRGESAWPLPRTRYTAYYLHSNGRANTLNGDGLLSLEPPGEDEVSDRFIYDPQNPVPSAGGTMLGPNAGIQPQNAVEERQDVLVYTTPLLRDAIEVTGPVQLRLQVSTTAPHTDFTAKLVDVHPDGTSYNVSEGILRRRYDKTQTPTEIAIDLWPTSQVFFPGHRIRLEVSSSSYPRFDRNPNTGRNIPTERQPVTATQTVYHHAAAVSRLILPIIPE
ncbi:CocE/NonD family hydrolase [Leptolyngbya sp. CCNP1308]|uniref:CocE/NonD family hydrolase n=1 Tax=Leptolyngbya sp. CCNP1308 TaxID=3110255 RepID=UPI002B2010F0|nr:CocE/NonD family hydrolase [Leptolyngbya sp. CCNP1308]MEA5449967.1 CocE/NonD family hydrolase [Leptolyngbya sp. CCNP1308]